MRDAEIYSETSTWRLQAREFLIEARRLKPGPERNELREVAAVLRELAEIEARSKPARDLGRRGT